MWACALEDGSCGPDLEYDNDYLELVKASQGRPESQFEPEVPPDWNAVQKLAERLLQRSRDLRLALYLAQAHLHQHGLGLLAEDLHGVLALLHRCWPQLNPPLDDGDPYPRFNAIDSMGPGGGLYQSLRNTLVAKAPMLGDVYLKDLEQIAHAGVAQSVRFSRDQVLQYFSAQADQANTLRSVCTQAGQAIAAIAQLAGSYTQLGQAPQLLEIQALLRALAKCLPPPLRAEQGATADETTASSQSPDVLPSAAGLAHQAHANFAAIQTRAHALMAIDAVCTYLDSTEPTNPAQLLLKRARRLIDKNFLELVKDLAPDALNEVARIMGVDPSSLDQGSQ